MEHYKLAWCSYLRVHPSRLWLTAPNIGFIRTVSNDGCYVGESELLALLYLLFSKVVHRHMHIATLSAFKER